MVGVVREGVVAGQLERPAAGDIRRTPATTVRAADAMGRTGLVDQDQKPGLEGREGLTGDRGG